MPIDAPTQEPTTTDTATLLDEYKKDIDLAAELMEDQRDKANQDMRFTSVSGGMWEDENSTFWDSDRAKMEFDLVSPYITRFIAEWNLNRVGVEFKPDDDATSDEDAELMDGMYRSDYRDGSGKLSVDNGVDELANCGYACWKLATRFEDDEDPDNDNQRIEWRPINNAFNSVFWDPAATRIDKADAKWCVVLTPFTKKTFEKVYPGIAPVSAFTPDSHRNLDWNNKEEIFVATRYETHKAKEKMFIYNNFAADEQESYNEEDHERVKDELKRDPARKFVRERMVMRRRVTKAVFTGDTFLEEPKRIPGKFIPIVPAYAYRRYIDGAEWYWGLVRKLIDATRLFNMLVSQVAENAASGNRRIPIVDAEQMTETMASEWADPQNKTFLRLNALRDDNGNVTHAGVLGYLESNEMDSNTSGLMTLVLDYIREITGGNPQEAIDPETSGKALNAILKRVSMNTQEIQDNIANAVEWSGKVYQAMAADVYNTPRMVRTIGLDGTHSRERIFKTVFDEETGKIVEANRISGKKFRVYADIGPQYETQREATVEALKGMGDMIRGTAVEGQYIPAIFSMMIQNVDGVGLGPLKEMNNRIMLAQGLKKPETPEEEQLLAQLQQPQEDPQQKLIEAAAAQQLAEARSLDAESLKDVADAEKKGAETQEIISKIGLDRAKTLVEIRREILENAQNLPIN